MNRIVLERIPQKRIRAFIKNQINNNVSCIRDIEASHQNGDCLENLLKHREEFHVQQPIDRVWKHYLSANPFEIWNGSFVSFGLMLCKEDNKIMYANENYSKAKVGQVYFMNLKILKGLYQLAVSHEIIGIDQKKKHIDISYIKGGKSVGFQRIALQSKGAEGTQIIHTSFYKSKSKFRDRYLYPYFHTKVLKEYHSNMIKHILNSSSER